MTIKEEIEIEEYKRTFAEAYKQGFIDAMIVCKTEPQTDKLTEEKRCIEGFIEMMKATNAYGINDKDKTEPQLTPNYCGTCKYREVPCGDLPCDVCHGYSHFEPKTEPITHDDYIETENDHLEARCLNCHNAKACKEKHWEVCRYEPWKLTAVDDEPQIDCSWR